MVTSSVLKHLLSDKDSLTDYLNGIIPLFEDVKRRLLLLERLEHRNLPDHYYRLNQEKSFDSIKSLGETIRIGLFQLAEEYLELRENRIYVKQLKQNNWQELITYIPPLILQMAFLSVKRPFIGEDSTQIIEYFNKYILPNTRYTALPYPFVPQLENYIKEKRGFHDLHMHLSGATETDIAWQNFLMEPDQVYHELKNGLRSPFVKEQFEQETYLRSPLEFKNLLLCARNIRGYMFMALFPSIRGKEKYAKISCSQDILTYFLDSKEAIPIEDNPFINASTYHPFAELVFKNSSNPPYPMAVEGLMYVLLFKYILTNPRESLSSSFHFYLLILGLVNRLLVQQVHQFGFEQFQKITLNELRENSEKFYKNRFLQLHGNDQRNIRFLEGRFSPKQTEKANMKLISSIIEGWNNLLNEVKKELSVRDEECPTLKLIAHFIKKKDDRESLEIRHKNLRYDVWNKAKVLAISKNKINLMKYVIGIDAAASEFDASPEVFAPPFRYLRRKGFKHFTYHAGEDFFHIISGLRAIYEAVVYNGLNCGDRIGHATAAGISPQIWIQNVGKTIFIRQGEYLDNLLFANHLIISKDNESLKKTVPSLYNKIQALSYSIYQKSYSLKMLEDAWLMRRFCPMILFSESRDRAKLLDFFDDDEWNDIENEFIDTVRDERVEILSKYHSANFRKEYDKIIEIKTEEYFNVTELETLQLLILEFLHEREIVIETLPTSNVRIGHHFDFDSYHLWNWLKWEKSGKPIPPIVVGTDDSGIFATNIYNEYANIYCNLISNNLVSHSEAMKIIEQLDKNGNIYKFV